MALTALSRAAPRSIVSLSKESRARHVRCTAHATDNASSGSPHKQRDVSRPLWRGCMLPVGLMLFGFVVFMMVGRRLLLGAGLATSLIVLPDSAAVAAVDIATRTGEVKHTEEEWLQIVGKDSFRVLRKAGTERPFTSPLNDEKRAGVFACAGCGAPLFNASMKYNSGTGWPSFNNVLPGAVDEVPDNGFFGARTEVRCHRCQGHLGHVFSDGPAPTGLRYCMNGVVLQFVPDESQPVKSA